MGKGLIRCERKPCREMERLWVGRRRTGKGKRKGNGMADWYVINARRPKELEEQDQTLPEQSTCRPVTCRGTGMEGRNGPGGGNRSRLERNVMEVRPKTQPNGWTKKGIGSISRVLKKKGLQGKEGKTEP